MKSVSINILKLIVLIFLLSSSASLAEDSLFLTQMNQGIDLFDAAYNDWNKELFLKASSFFQGLEKSQNQSFLPLYWQGVIHFYLVTYHLFGYEKDIDKGAAKVYLNRAIDLLRQSQGKTTDNAEIIALLGTLYGIRIYLDPLTSVVLGKKVFKNIKESLAKDSTNPRIYYLVGMSYYHTPRILGGGFKKSKEYLLLAENYFAEENNQRGNSFSPRWGYSTCLSFLGKIHLRREKYGVSRSYFNKALQINPKDQLALLGLSRIDKQK